MLQRAASNAYSWWWASHIRTKQSKWLEQNLQDMEEKVQIVLKMIEEDGDSFARRAEMYYKKRPELISFVEESYRAYRALAERYDKLSTELQNANNTIATVFPEQVQFSMDEEDDEAPPRVPKNFPQFTENNVPQVPQNFPAKDLKGLLTSTSKNIQAKKTLWGSKAANKTPPKSGLTEAEALEEIDKLQKEILAQQTVKEFVKSSYEGGIAKYWEIENHIMEMQDRVFNLEDEFNVGKVFEDNEARTLMAEAALKSCEGTLAQLEERHEKSTVEARVEGKRVEDARQKLNSLKNKFLPGEGSGVEEEEENVNVKDESEKATQIPETLTLSSEKATQKSDTNTTVQEEKTVEEAKEPSTDSITVTELAEKVDDLVSKVIGLEAAVSSQTALIDRLRTENDNLHAQIRILEDDKASLIKSTHVLTRSLNEMQEKLNACQNLNQNVESQNIRIRTHFIEARCCLDHICGRLHCVKPYEESEYAASIPEEEESSVGITTPEEFGKREVLSSPSYGGAINPRRDEENGKVVGGIVKNEIVEEKGDEKVYGRESSSDKPDDLILADTAEDFEVLRRRPADGKQQDEVTEGDDEPSWQEMLLHGLEDREEVLLEEYNAVLRNYKDAKKQLTDVEQKNRDNLFETSVQLRELRSGIARRDREIQLLRQKLNLLQGNKDFKDGDSPNPALLDEQDISVELNEELKVNRDVEDPTGKNKVKAEESKPKAEADTEDVKSLPMDEQTKSLIEEKLRMNIDALLDENLDFWLRFGSSFHQIQKFQTRFDDLKGEIAKVRRKADKDGNGKKDIRSEVRPIYKHLREIQTELTVWIGRSALLKDELQRRFSSLCSIQEDITKALNEGAEEEEMKFTSHEAAKFQGEILNMKQENNKVRNELQSGLDHVTTLRKEIETTLEQINDEFGLSKKSSKVRIPLRSFLFEAKPKRKSSIFSFIHHRKYHQSRSSELPM